MTDERHKRGLLVALSPAGRCGAACCCCCYWEVPVPMVKGDVKRATRPFEDKVKKVQRAPRMRPLLGPGSSRSSSPGGKGGKRQEIERERDREKA